MTTGIAQKGHERMSVKGVEILGAVPDDLSHVLTPEALDFIAGLHRQFDERRIELLAMRPDRAAALVAGDYDALRNPDPVVREGDWQVAPAAPALNDRRSEITGPTDRKMMINALNSGAKVFMVDFEDSLSPTWWNVIDGQRNVMDAVRRTISFENPDGRKYELNDQIATLLIRPRGWHLGERHLLIDGEPISASLFDFGLSFFHNAQERLDRGDGPFYYLPKMESYLEARLWNDVFVAAQEALGVPQGSVRATVLIETILAAFQMEDILYELRDHSAGLNAGRWDYIFSLIKTFRTSQDHVLPDRGQVTMAVPFMRAYTELLVRTCHKRGAHAIGGMAAFIPSRRDPEVNKVALAKVREDKEREANAAFDGTWLAHPDLVPIANEIFDAKMGAKPNQKDNLREDVSIEPAQLVDTAIPGSSITEDGLRMNVSVGMQYIDSWLRGNGAAAINNLMEDAATAEISRAQIWQWIRTGSSTSDGEPITIERYRTIRDEELDKLGRTPTLEQAAGVLDLLIDSDDFIPFLTIPAYSLLD
jgi:malate synthase